MNGTLLSDGVYVGRYRIDSLIGRGGMGEVYKAHDSRLDRYVALKVLPSLVERPERIKRFIQEAKSVSALNHPNIIVVYDAGEESIAGEPDRVHYIAMELVEGRSLREEIYSRGASPKRLLELLTQTADGLAYAHASGIIHRDLKPDNIMVVRDHAKVLDFGLAKLREDRIRDPTASATTLPRTREGAILGTVGYMSPEQVRGKEADHRSDIFSFGCTLYEALTRRRPFEADSEVDTLHKIAHDEPPSIARDLASPELQRLINRCLAKDPADRPQSMTDVAAALREIQESPVSSPSAPRLRSIVVLPFVNMSPDPDNEYFVDGLTEELITDLSRVHALRVISRTSTMRLKGSEKDLRTIARELNVQYVLEGSVRRAGQNLRVAAQLIDATDDSHLWADKYAGTLEDVFEIQEKLSRTIVDALEVTLTPEESRRLGERPIHNPHAYECYLRARKEILLFSAPALDRALKLIEDALSIVGDDPLLYATQAYVIGHYRMAGIKIDEEYLKKAEEAVEKAFALAPDSYYGHLARGLLRHSRGDLQGAARDLNMVSAIDPSNPDCLALLGYIYALSGREAAARKLLNRLIEIDPLTPVNYCMPGFVSVMEGHPEEAIEPYRRFYELAPESPAAHWFYAWALAWNNRFDELDAIAERLTRIAPKTAFESACLVLKHSVRGERQKAVDAVTPELRAAAQDTEMFSRELANSLAYAGETDEALHWLENANRLGLINYPFLAERDRFLEALRPEPRFQRLMERVKQQWEAFQM